MPAVNPRIAVYLPRSTAMAIRRLAGLRGVSRSAVIRDFLVEAEPVLVRIANLLDLAARTDRTALKAFAAELEGAQSQVESHALDAMATLERAEADLGGRAGGKRQRRSRRTTPGQ